MADAAIHGHEHHRPGFFTRWFMSTNHKDIGILYLFVGGAVVRAGDFVVDGSLRGRIERLGNLMAGA